MTDQQSPIETRPATVAIVALGPSNTDYVASTTCKKNFLQAEEVWVVNSGAGVLNADKVFIMDDLKRIQGRFPDWAEKLKKLNTPIITAHAYPEFPTSVAYPKDEVCEHFKDDYFTTTVAYMLAYAIYIGVKEIYLFGCDFWYPNSAAVEPGIGCVSYYLGIAKERGINFKIPNSSTLMDAHMVSLDEKGKRQRPMYGYDYNPGESRDRVMKGEGSRLDHLAACYAPFIHGAKPDGQAKPQEQKNAVQP